MKFASVSLARAVRPEDIHDKVFYTGGPSDDRTIKAVVDVVEPMGNEIFLYLNTAEHNLTIRAAHDNKARVGQHIDLVIDTNCNRPTNADVRLPAPEPSRSSSSSSSLTLLSLSLS